MSMGLHRDTRGIFDRVALGGDVVDGVGGHGVLVGEVVEVVLADVGVTL